MNEVENIPAEIRGKRPTGAAHSPWELLEHMRIAGARTVMAAAIAAITISPSLNTASEPHVLSIKHR